jgi:uncharacterized OB-fold protein
MSEMNIATMTAAPIPVVGDIGPEDDGVDAPFWAGLREHEVRLQRCQDCDTWVWPPRWSCTTCLGTRLAWTATPASGVIYAWTRTHHAFVPDMASALPYIVVLVELDGAGGRRLLGILVGSDSVRIGDRVAGVLQESSDLTGDYAVLRWVKVVGDGV